MDILLFIVGWVIGFAIGEVIFVVWIEPRFRS